ncbi:MAG: CRISPR-associated helicase Cas3' [Oscillospiraceae bacterium]|jgi:CRISPR-associated endonuclease/helicase Cas3
MYIGHTSLDGRRQLLSEHLNNVAQLCADFAKPWGAGEVAKVIGLCHDIGKYSQAAQKRLLENGYKVDHSTAGGLEAARLCGLLGAYCVFGHHGGLPDGGSPADTYGEPTMLGRCKRQVGKHIPDYAAFQSEITLAPPPEPVFYPLRDAGFSVSMLIRMLFSCLVDADYLDTERFMSDGNIRRGGYDSIPTLHQKLTNHLKQFANPSSNLNRKRNEILEQCIAKAGGQKGLYSLTVPTGGGKTLSSLAFALNHAQKHGMERVIYVIPYTSIIEQNAEVFAKILGRENVLEHHSGFEYDNETDEDMARRFYLSTENWDAPIIVTTNVQFFESLFAHKTSKCRKLHHIAGSVIIFDEAQMLPMPYLLPCVYGMAELVHNYGCTLVLCSATQPALEGLFPPEIRCEEICHDPVELHNFFRRTTVQRLGTLSDEELAQQMNALPQVLCIVNTRKHAQNLYRLLQSKGSYHLSTLMYPEHRKAILNEIRARLKQGLPCRVVATSLIEAGVDVDFPVVYRAKAGLDSVVQAAGRCNREGRRPAAQSPVYVFDPQGDYTLPVTQRQSAEVLELVTVKYRGNFTCLDAIRYYFERLYDIKGDALDVKRIVAQLEDGMKNGGSFPFKTIGEEFRLIESKTYTIFIPDTAVAEEYARRLRAGERNRQLLRQVGRYSVNIYENHYRQLCQMGMVETLDEQLAVLAVMDSYDAKTGLALEPEGGKGLFI